MSSSKTHTDTSHITSDTSPIQDNQYDIQERSPNESTIRFTPPIGPEAEVYNMKHSKRGKAIIFNHENFHEALKLDKRTGTRKDRVLLEQCFKKFNFEVQVHDDFKFYQIEKCLKEVSQEDHRNEDCLIVVVLTHGKNDTQLFAFDRDYKNEEIWNYFRADECPSLAGKPKVFIIQACRGSDISAAVKFNSFVQADGNVNAGVMSHRYSLPVEADILLAFSTYKGNVAIRNTKEGAWFIQEFCNELNENGEVLDILSLMTNVNRRVAVDKEHKHFKQMPVVQSTLTRKLYLNSEPISDDQKTTNAVLNDKLNSIKDVLETMNTVPTSIQKNKVIKKKVPGSKWEELQISTCTFDFDMTELDILKHAKTLKMFLEDCSVKLQPAVRSDGEFVLMLFSNWESINNEIKCHSYMKLIKYLHENAKDWKYLEITNIPDSSIFNIERCKHRFSVMSDSNISQIKSSHSKSLGRLPRKFN